MVQLWKRAVQERTHWMHKSFLWYFSRFSSPFFSDGLTLFVTKSGNSKNEKRRKTLQNVNSAVALCDSRCDYVLFAIRFFQHQSEATWHEKEATKKKQTEKEWGKRHGDTRMLVFVMKDFVMAKSFFPQIFGNSHAFEFTKPWLSKVLFVPSYSSSLCSWNMYHVDLFGFKINIG